MDEVADSGRQVVITKHGHPVSRLVPYCRKSKLVFGRNRENIEIIGDIVSPMPAEWFDKPGESDEYLF
ncbi:MAG: type II toxin-antitoxin system prevent-host-death family antitoxin [bacterium]|nr:type II toxin-antitoxin system Phd/YefM family antitoxin [Acidimicrobiia bacterium]MCY4650955.1 type II toxin-antitoxin system prevent-host-death family antitoxin [bacterium]